MREEKVVKIDGKDITVKELKVSQIIKITKRFPEFEGKEMAEVLELVKSILPMCVADLSEEDLYEMTPSELQTLYDTFKEVNDVFFGTLDKLGISEMLSKVKDLTLDNLSSSFVELSQTDTDQ